MRLNTYLFIGAFAAVSVGAFIGFIVRAPQGQFSVDLMIALASLLWAAAWVNVLAQEREAHGDLTFEFFISLDEDELRSRGWTMAKVEALASWRYMQQRAPEAWQ